MKQWGVTSESRAQLARFRRQVPWTSPQHNTFPLSVRPAQDHLHLSSSIHRSSPPNSKENRKSKLHLTPVIQHVLAQADTTNFGVLLSNYYINCTLVELKVSNIIGDSGTVTDSKPLPFMILLLFGMHLVC